MSDTTTTDLPDGAQKLADEQADEYGTYRAVVPIDHDGARAYNVGHPVPASNVKRYGYLEQGLVERVGSPTADGDLAPRPALSGEPGGDEPHPALSGEPGGDEPHPALSGEPNVLDLGNSGTGNPDHPDVNR